MNDQQNQTEAACGGSDLSERLGFMAQKRDKPMSRRQRDLLAMAPAEWCKLPHGIDCTNMTLEVLERRGLVETRYGEDGGFMYEGLEYFWWQWRKAPNAKLTGRATGPND